MRQDKHPKLRLLEYEAISLASGEYGLAKREASLLVEKEEQDLERKKYKKKMKKLS